MLSAARVLIFALTVVVLFVACGARSGLVVDDPDGSLAGVDASLDSTADVVSEVRPEDVVADVSRDGFSLDVGIDCATPSYCDPVDPSKIFQCNTPIFQCGSLEQCQMRGESGAECVNPCVDTLGQDTSNGCEFFAVHMDATDEVAGVCFAVFVVNQWKSGEPARIEVSRGGSTLPVAQFARIPVGTGTNITYAPYDPGVGLARDQVAILFLARDPNALTRPGNPTDPNKLAGCPAGVTPAFVGDAAAHGTGRGTAFQLKTNVPVVAYQILPYGGGRARVTGASLLLPTNVWGNNYIAMNAFAAPTLFSQPRAGPTMAIVGREDNTQVTVRPTADILAGGGLAGSPANTPVQYTVNRGEYLQFTQPVELSGSVVAANKPVAVFGGSTLMDIPLATQRADGAHQMLPPVSALADEYVAVRYRSRSPNGEEVVPWRIVGAVDGTTLTYEPARPLGAPATLASRQVVEFETSGPFVVRSQDAAHPFYMAAYMTGGQPFDGEGDPEFVNIVSPKQYLPRYTFFTDPTYPETNLVLVRVRDPDSGLFPEVKLDCAGLLTGWQAVGVSSKYEFLRFDLSRGDFQGQNGCDNGVHTVEGTSINAKIGVTVWGWGNPITFSGTDETHPRATRWVSYAYPAGANLGQLNNVVVPAN